MSDQYRFERFDRLTPRDRLAKARWAYDRKYEAASISTSVLHAGERLVDMAHAHGIQVIGIQNPVTAEWDKLEEDDRRRYEYDRMLKRLKVDHVLDYRRLYTSNPEYFHDPDHLNDTGAHIFSARLYTDIQHLLGRSDRRRFQCKDIPLSSNIPVMWPYRTVTWKDVRDIVRNQTGFLVDMPDIGMRAVGHPSAFTAKGE